MYEVDKEYISLMLACKHPQKNNIKHCISKILLMDKEYVDDYYIMVWLSKAVEAFRPYAKSISSQGIREISDYLEKYDYIYKPKYDNQYQRINQWLIHLLRGLRVRQCDENGNLYDLYDLGK